MEKMPITELPLRNSDRVALVDGDYDGEYFSQYTWYLLKNGRVGRKNPDANGYIYLHKEVCWTPEGMWVEHIDGDYLNNRSCNLHWVTPSEACIKRRQSARKHKNRYRGVVKQKSKRWTSKWWQVTFRGEQYAERFALARDAAKFYDELAYERYGDKAVLNFKRA